MQTVGDQLKLEGMERVLARSPEEWREHVDGVIRRLTPGSLVSGETIRLRCRLAPHHPNAWGAVIRAHVSSGWLVPTGRYVKPMDPRSHSRLIQLYRVFNLPLSEGGSDENQRDT